MTFVQLCDPQLGFGAYQRDLRVLRQAVRQINALSPDCVAVCGDLVNSLGDPGGFADVAGALDGLEAPCYCVPGNHDIGDADPKLLQRFRETIGPDCQSFELGGYAFIAANSQLWVSDGGQESARHDGWVTRELRAASAAGRPVILIMHHPLFIMDAAEADGYFNMPRELRRDLLERFHRHGVRAVLTGHAHRTLVNSYQGIAFVTSGTTSRNFDGKPFGYRIWRAEGSGALTHEYAPVDMSALETGLYVEGRAEGATDYARGQVVAVRGEAAEGPWSAGRIAALDHQVAGRAELDEGRFRIPYLEPDSYALVALAASQDGSVSAWAAAAVTLEATPARGVLLRLERTR